MTDTATYICADCVHFRKGVVTVHGVTIDFCFSPLLDRNVVYGGVIPGRPELTHDTTKCSFEAKSPSRRWWQR